MKHDTVAWSLRAGGHRYTYLVHGRLLALSHNGAPWIVADHMSAQAAHDAAVASTAAQKATAIISGPASFALPLVFAQSLRESGTLPDEATAYIAAKLRA